MRAEKKYIFDEMRPEYSYNIKTCQNLHHASQVTNFTTICLATVNFLHYKRHGKNNLQIFATSLSKTY